MTKVEMIATLRELRADLARLSLVCLAQQDRMDELERALARIREDSRGFERTRPVEPWHGPFSPPVWVDRTAPWRPAPGDVWCVSTAGVVVESHDAGGTCDVC